MDAPHAMISILLKTRNAQLVKRSNIVLHVIHRGNALSVIKVSLQVEEYVLVALIIALNALKLMAASHVKTLILSKTKYALRALQSSIVLPVTLKGNALSVIKVSMQAKEFAQHALSIASNVQKQTDVRNVRILTL